MKSYARAYDYNIPVFKQDKTRKFMQFSCLNATKLRAHFVKSVQCRCVSPKLASDVKMCDL